MKRLAVGTCIAALAATTVGASSGDAPPATQQDNKQQIQQLAAGYLAQQATLDNLLGAAGMFGSDTMGRINQLYALLDKIQ